MGYPEYFGLICPPWLKGTLGRSLFTTLGEFQDENTNLADAAMRTRMPAYCPYDALEDLSGNRGGLIKWSGETYNQFRSRLASAWTEWYWAGTRRAMFSAMAAVGFEIDSWDMIETWGDGGTWSSGGNVQVMYAMETGNHENIVLDGDFDQEYVVWTAGQNWSITGGTAVCAKSAGTLGQVCYLPPVTGPYILQYQIVSGAPPGTIHAEIGFSTFVQTDRQIEGTYQETGEIYREASMLEFVPDAKFYGSVDKVSLCRSDGRADAGPLYWSRFWVVVDGYAEGFTHDSTTWGDDGVWDNVAVWGLLNVTPTQVAEWVLSIELMRPAHAECRAIAVIMSNGRWPDIWGGAFGVWDGDDDSVWPENGIVLYHDTWLEL